MRSRAWVLLLIPVTAILVGLFVFWAVTTISGWSHPLPTGDFRWPW